MKNLPAIIGIIIIVGVILSLIVFTAVSTGYEYGYKEACKDFYMGNLKMRLIENKDGTKTWKWNHE